MSDSYVRQQATIAAAVHVVVNPLVAWLLNPEMETVTVSDMAGDLVTTSLVLCLLVALFGAHRARKALASGREIRLDRSSPEAQALSRLPQRPGAFGLLLGAVAALAAGLALWILGVVGLSGMGFLAYAAVKAGYTGALAYAVMRWAVLRQVVAPLVPAPVA